MDVELPERLATAAFPSNPLEVVRTLREAGYSAYLVGGCIRDTLLGKQQKDFDVATDAHPAQVQRTFKKVIPTGIDHGTVTVLIRGEPIEVTTFRTEAGYVDGRRPSSVQFHSEIEADLSRRDFTINAMAFDPLGRRFVDPFGGQADLERRIIRCVGEAFDRFSEDGLRALRAVRFASVLEFTLDPGTEAAIPRTLDVFSKVATERVNQELVKLLTARAPGHGAELLGRTGLLSRFLPALPTVDSARAQALDRAEPSLPIRLAVLLHGVPSPREVLLGLKFPTRTCDEVANLLAHPLPPEGATDVDLRRWMSALGPDAVPSALALARAREGGRVEPHAARIATLAQQAPPLAIRDLALQGKALMGVLGVGPSPKVGQAGRFLLARVLEDPSLNTPAQLSDLLRKWAKGEEV
jgi:tRNA nucleotidyltransferase (CCA-adding enzyme)